MLALGAISGIAAYAAGRPEFLVFAGFAILLPLLALAWVRFRRVAYRADREFTPPVVAAGMTSSVALTVTNVAPSTSPAAWWRDTWPWRPYVTDPQEIGALQPAGGYRRTTSRTRVAYEIRPYRRGVFEIGPLILDFADPFGLADSAVVAEGTQRLVVTPGLIDLPEGAVALAVDEGPTRMPTRRTFGGEDDTMTREYRRGDAMRRVHWRASAHKGELMVRQEEQQNNAEARIVLDTLRTSYRDSRGRGTIDEPESDTFEWAIDLVASLAAYLASRGFQVEVVETGHPQLDSMDEPGRFLESLASLQLTDARADAFSLLRSAARSDRPQGSVFAVLSSADEHVIARLVAQRRSFDLAVVFLVDTRAYRLATPLREAGWLCVPVYDSDSIEDAWLAVGAEQEAAHGRA
ncbi:MAG: hypothetical protein JWO10_504 [Microbacteriaceae bacterium]|nr:hypothetical protein [Microbacteriaceae bacterium]